jgi:transcription initiation factor IIE alpha subunit
MEHHENQDKKKYSCPMHPEVQSDQPGTCPKCGMKLVEKDKQSGRKNKKA